MSRYELSPQAPPVPTTDDLHAAHHAVTSVLPPTPLIPLDLPGHDGQAFIKWEGSQPTGSFKVRGGLAAVAAYGTQAPLVAASAGNHGAGLAWASRATGHPATIVIPDSTPDVKRALLNELGARVIIGGPDYDTAETHAVRLSQDGYRFVSAYNDTAVIAGQSTMLVELQEQLPNTNQLTVVIPVGGGGLLAGSTLVAATETHCVGVETHQSTAISAAVQRGQHTPVVVGQSLADGLAGNIEPSSVTPAIIAASSAELLTVTEQHIREAIAWVARHAGLICEGSAATTIAAYLSGQVQTAPTTTLVFALTGRNITPTTFQKVCESC